MKHRLEMNCLEMGKKNLDRNAKETWLKVASPSISVNVVAIVTSSIFHKN